MSKKNYQLNNNFLLILKNYFNNSIELCNKEEKSLIKDYDFLKYNNVISCDDVVKDISAYYDGELPINRYYRIKEHIENCKYCQVELENINKLRIIIKSSFKNTDFSNCFSLKSYGININKKKNYELYYMKNITKYKNLINLNKLNWSIISFIFLAIGTICFSLSNICHYSYLIKFFLK